MKTMEWKDGCLWLLDQTALPLEECQRCCEDYQAVADAICKLEVRGAPAIGAAAAYGLVLGAKSVEHADDFSAQLQRIAKDLKATRPTAVNLSWAIKRMLQAAQAHEHQPPAVIVAALEEEANAIAREDVLINQRMSRFGASLFDASNPITVLTHCNAGSLATVEQGTALGVIREAYRRGGISGVYADETRPLLQGARLTAWELSKDSIPVTLITDNMAGYVMKLGRVKAVIVGADRIAANGDVANKIGTYSVAVLAKEHGLPFYVAAPFSTFDVSLATGEGIPIEERHASEVTHFAGKATAPQGIAVFNPAFDVTPHEYVSAIITEYGVLRAPYDQAIAAMRQQAAQPAQQ